MLHFFLGACLACSFPTEIALVAGGDFEPGLSDELRAYNKVVAIDSGLTYCQQANIEPSLIFGDLAGVDQGLLSRYDNTDQVVLERAKDYSDVEAFLILLTLSDAKVTLYGGLGNRFDFSLHNLYVLQRYPGQLRVKTEGETLFAVGPEQKEFCIDCRKGQSVSFLRIGRDIEGVSAVGANSRGKFRLSEAYPYRTMTCSDDHLKISVDEGNVIVILHEHPPRPLPVLPVSGIVRYDFGLDRSVLNHFQVLQHLAKHPKSLVIEAGGTHIFALNKEENEATLEAKVGQSISLIPLFGAAEGIKTSGMKWELSPTTIGTLDQDFVSLDNIAKKENPRVSLEKGVLACMVNRDVFEPAVLELEDRSRTRRLCERADRGIAIVANGEIERGLQEELRKFTRVIALDNGLSHCHAMGVEPSLIFGDFDSVNEELLGSYSHVNQIVLDRAKDLTDLEAILAALKLTGVEMTLFAGLGNRIDHTLLNLYLLYRYPGKLEIKSKNERLFAVKQEQGRCWFPCKEGETLSLINFFGAVEGISLAGTSSKERVDLGRGSPIYTTICQEEMISLNVEKGTVIGVISKGEQTLLPKSYDSEAVHYDFGAKNSLIEHFRVFKHLAKSPMKAYVDADHFQIYVADDAVGEVSFETVPGQTISLIPLFGPARGITTHGLKWELSPETIGDLDHNFVSLSNVAVGDKVTLSVGSGVLACIINKDLIDTEMLELKDRSKTGILTKPAGLRE